jgi:hypothetical protein
MSHYRSLNATLLVGTNTTGQLFLDGNVTDIYLEPNLILGPNIQAPYGY